MRKNILSVVANKEINRILKLTFLDEGFYVDTASSTESAIELCEKNEYFTVFIDTKDENIDGTNICNTIKKRKPGSRVIAMTSFDAIYKSEHYIKAGYDSFFPMPNDTRDLIRAVRNAIVGKAVF